MQSEVGDLEIRLERHLNQITNKARIRYLDISNRDLNGTADLKDFTSLKSLNSYNNKFEDLDWLLTLPQKDKLEKINFYGNKLKEVDFAQLLSDFPNLQSINLENNPVKTKNLNNLTSTQFSKLVQGIKDKKIKVNSWKGTILMDLLEYAQQLVARGGSTHHSHLQTLKTIINQEKPTPKPLKEISQEQPTKSPTNPNPLYFIGGLVLVVGSVLAIGYWWGKSKRQKELDF